jgi:hypothetical protein
MSDKVIVYHNNCHDGITALWAARQRLPESDAYEAKYDDAPDFERLIGCDVVFVDFCWSLQTMIEVRCRARSLLVLDHHKSAMSAMVGGGENLIDLRTWTGPITWARHMDNVAQDELENVHSTIYMLFDMDRSGAGIAYGLRSAEDGLDVSQIAAQYGGGGHRNAAGFVVRPKESA